MYSIHVYTDANGTSFDCYECAQDDCEAKPFLTLEAEDSRYVCGDCEQVTPATYVEDSETSGHWAPDEDPVVSGAAA